MSIIQIKWDKLNPYWNLDVAEGNTEMAQQRLEDMACLSVAAIAALTHLPVTAIIADGAKRKVLIGLL